MENNFLEKDPAKRLENLNNKVKEFEKKKIEAESELKILKKQHAELLQQLKDNGIENVENLPEIIKELEEEFNQKLEDAENNAKEIESGLSSFHETLEG